MEESERFTHGLVEKRGNEHRQRPFFLGLPLRSILLKMHSVFASSKEMDPFQVLGLGNILLSFLQALVAHQATASGVQDPDFHKYLDFLEKIFHRLSSMSYEDESGDVKRFLDRVWEMHTNGTIDLSRTAIPGKIVVASPSRLESVLSSCIGNEEDLNISDVSSSSLLLPFCDRNPQNFIKIMEFLELRFSKSSSNPAIMEQIIDFTKSFQTLLLNKVGSRDWVSLYPSEFCPLLNFLQAIGRHPQSRQSQDLFHDKAVMDELLKLLNSLCRECELNQTSSTILKFFLLSFPNFSVNQIISRCSRRQLCKWQWIRLCIKVN